MYILWTSHPTNPKLNGTKEHVPRSVAEVAIYNHTATLAPRPNYGTKEWTEERQALDAQRGHPAGDVVPPTLTPGWGVSRKINAAAPNGYAIYLIESRVSGEVVRYETAQVDLAIKNGCPAAIIAEFKRQIDTPDSVAVTSAETEKARQQQQEQAAKNFPFFSTVRAAVMKGRV